MSELETGRGRLSRQNSLTLQEKGIRISSVLNMIVPRETLIDRLTSRRVCGKCGATFNVHAVPPPPQGACADASVNCQGEHIVQRSDDQPDTVAQCLDVYTENTRPLIAYYRERGLLTDVDADAAPDEVYDRLTGVLA